MNRFIPANDNRLDPLGRAAEDFLQSRGLLTRFEGARPLLVARCARVMRDRFAIPYRDALAASERSAGEVLKQGPVCFFDLAASSANRVVLVNPAAGTRQEITLAKAQHLAARMAAPNASGHATA